MKKEARKDCWRNPTKKERAKLLKMLADDLEKRNEPLEIVILPKIDLNLKP